MVLCDLVGKGVVLKRTFQRKRIDVSTTSSEVVTSVDSEMIHAQVVKASDSVAEQSRSQEYLRPDHSTYYDYCSHKHLSHRKNIDK